MSTTPVPLPRKQTIDLASLTSGKAFFMGVNTEVLWYCKVAERRGDRINFTVVNGQWSGTLCSITGALLTAAGETVDDSCATVVCTADLPKSIDHWDYNAAIRYVRDVLKSAMPFDNPTENPSSPGL
jgi:hypothetical protein